MCTDCSSSQGHRRWAGLGSITSQGCPRSMDQYQRGLKGNNANSQPVLLRRGLSQTTPAGAYPMGLHTNSCRGQPVDRQSVSRKVKCHHHVYHPPNGHKDTKEQAEQHQRPRLPRCALRMNVVTSVNRHPGLMREDDCQNS